MNPEEIRRLDLERDHLLLVNRGPSAHVPVSPPPAPPGRCAVCGNLMTPGLCCEADALKKKVEALTWYLRYSLGQLEDLASRPDTLDAWVGHEMIKEIRKLVGKEKKA